MNDAVQRYLEAASGLSQVTAKKAERIAKNLVRSGEAASDQVGDLVDDLLERSGRNREAILALVKAESTRVVRSMGLASNKELDRLQKQVADLKRALSRSERGSTSSSESSASGSSSAKKSAKKTGKKSAAKKSAAKKTGGKKTAAKKTAAKKTAAKKTAAKKTAAKKTGGKKTAAKKSASKKTAAKKSAAKKTGGKKTASKKTAAKTTATAPAMGTVQKATPVTPPGLDERGLAQAGADARDEATRRGDIPPESSPVLAEALERATGAGNA